MISESSFHKYRYINRFGICYNKAIVGSIPVNLVNKEIYTNQITNDFGADELLKLWKNNKKIDYKKYYKMEFNDILKLKFQFVERETIT